MAFKEGMTQAEYDADIAATVKAEADKGAAALAAEAGKYAAPENYADFKFPDGFKPQDNMLVEFRNVAKAAGLRQEGAQALVDFHAKMVSEMQAAHKREGDQLHEGWKTALKGDKDLGGANLDKNLGLAVKVRDKFGNDGLKSILDATGFGDHPEIVRFMVAVGNAIGEDRLVTGTGGASPARQPGEVNLDTFYPSMKK